MEASGVLCDLITGQERIIKEENNSTHISCTIESLNFNRKYDVCVIDEVQLLGDEFRGAAWTLSILGVQSKEIHVCGDDRAQFLLSEFCKLTGDELQIIKHERLSKLHVVNDQLFDLNTDLQEGDCIISFNAKSLFQLKQKINQIENIKIKNQLIYKTIQKQELLMLKSKQQMEQQKTKLNQQQELELQNIRQKITDIKQKEDQTNRNFCSVIYGKLPSETRKQQAKRFNERQENIKYLLATDAIGLGLNLNINRIIFWELWKSTNLLDKNGCQYKTTMKLDPFSIRQVAGRAGRFIKDGFVMARNKSDLQTINDAIYNLKLFNNIKNNNNYNNNKIQGKVNVKQAAIFPRFNTISDFFMMLQNNLMEKISFFKAIKLFFENQNVEGIYFIQGGERILKIAYILQDFDIDLESAYKICQCPYDFNGIKIEDQNVIVDSQDVEVETFRNIINQLIKYNKVKLSKSVKKKNTYLKKNIKQEKLEEFLKIYRELVIYQWFHNQFNDAFEEINICLKYLDKINNIVDNILQKN